MAHCSGSSAFSRSVHSAGASPWGATGVFQCALSQLLRLSSGTVASIFASAFAKFLGPDSAGSASMEGWSCVPWVLRPQGQRRPESADTAHTAPSPRRRFDPCIRCLFLRFSGLSTRGDPEMGRPRGRARDAKIRRATKVARPVGTLFVRECSGANWLRYRPMQPR